VTRVRTRLGAALLVAALVLLGTSSPVRTAAATAPRSLAPGDHDFALSVEGINRSFILHVPPGPAVVKRPLILVYHGVDATAGGTIGVTDFEQEANRTGELVAFLQGVNNHWNEYSGIFGSEGVNDIAYTAAVIKDIERHIGFDHSRIVAAGFSNGALMVESLGCQLSKTLAMIVPVEGQLTTSMVKQCKPARPISLYEIHGTSDALIPYGGGGRLSVLSAPASAARWARLDHCAAKPTHRRPNGSEMVTVYGGCNASAHVSLLTIFGGVHRWTPQIGEIVTAAFPWRK
jgi:polyhydroxybutyrate depolymerase